MILDSLDNAHRYVSLNKGFEKAFEFLNRPDLKELPAAKYDIDKDLVFAIVANEQGRKAEDAQLETHNKYIDIQFILSGIDNMGWKPKLSCYQKATEYNLKNDLQFFTNKPDVWLAVKSGMFAIFFPEDAHMPLISSEQIHKVIVKIALDQ